MVYTSEFPFAYVTADVVALSVRPGTGLNVLLVRRANPPFQGGWALPGGFVDDDEELEAAARRELEEETGVVAGDLRLEQLGAFGRPGRDPRHRTVSVAWITALPGDVAPRAGDDAAAAQWRPVAELESEAGVLAFDHAEILAAGVERLRRRIEHTDLALSLVNKEFTIAELREVYEAVWGRRLDPGNFQRKITGLAGFLAPTGRRTSHGRGRPAAVFTAGSTSTIWPPLSRDTEH